MRSRRRYRLLCKALLTACVTHAGGAIAGTLDELHQKLDNTAIAVFDLRQPSATPAEPATPEGKAITKRKAVDSGALEAKATDDKASGSPQSENTYVFPNAPADLINKLFAAGVTEVPDPASKEPTACLARDAFAVLATYLKEQRPRPICEDLTSSYKIWNTIPSCVADIITSQFSSREVDNRWIATEPESISVFAFYDVTTLSEPEISFVEKSRSLQILADLGTFVKIAPKLPAIKRTGDRCQDYRFAFKAYPLKKVRAKLTISAKAASPADKVAVNVSSPEPKGSTAEDQLKAAADRLTTAAEALSKASSSTVESEAAKKTTNATSDLITGPAESWYLSADLPVNQTKQLKFDDKSKTLVSKDTPKQFYFGINYMFGDIFSVRECFVRRLGIKALFRASRKPLDSLGIAASYRFRPASGFGYDLDWLSPFVGYVWTKEDTIDSNGTVRSNDKYRGHLAAGVSFNLDKALQWLKPEASTTENTADASKP